MGSKSDFEIMSEAIDILKSFGVKTEYDIVSAHRTPKKMIEYATNAELKGIKVIIAGAGGAAHLPGMVASKTCIPVIGVPIMPRSLSGLDSLYSILQMPKGCPVATMAIGTPGAINAALFATSILALSDEKIATDLRCFHEKQTTRVPEVPQDE